MSAADFFLVVHDCVTGPDGRPTETEIFGYYRILNQDDRDTLQTAFINVPPGSPIARMAHQVSADPDGTLTRAADLILRASIARCPCTARAGGYYPLAPWAGFAVECAWAAAALALAFYLLRRRDA